MLNNQQVYEQAKLTGHNILCNMNIILKYIFFFQQLLLDKCISFASFKHNHSHSPLVHISTCCILLPRRPRTSEENGAQI